MANIKKEGQFGDTEVWLDGKFVSSFREILVLDEDLPVICNMLESAREFGRAEAKREIREALGVK